MKLIVSKCGKCDIIFKSSIFDTISPHRGNNFCKPFFEIGTVRSLLPKSVNIMALTATATKQTVSIVTDHLAMSNWLNSDRPNIKYIVKPS